MGVGGGVGGGCLCGEGVWRWLPVVSVIRDGPTNLPPGMWQISKQRGGGMDRSRNKCIYSRFAFHFWEAI